MTAELTDADEGKRVVDADGEAIGIVSGVRGDTAYVDPDPGIAEPLLSRLGWASVDETDRPLDAERVAAVTDGEVRLRREP